MSISFLFVMFVKYKTNTQAYACLEWGFLYGRRCKGTESLAEGKVNCLSEVKSLVGCSLSCLRATASVCCGRWKTKIDIRIFFFSSQSKAERNTCSQVEKSCVFSPIHFRMLDYSSLANLHSYRVGGEHIFRP